jgi:hypothetical protein
MRQPLFGTLTEIARHRGLDARNRILRDLPPAAFLVSGGKRFALFELSDGDVAETSNLTNRVSALPKAIL